jgi:hypothetical protein
MSIVPGFYGGFTAINLSDDYEQLVNVLKRYATNVWRYFTLHNFKIRIEQRGFKGVDPVVILEPEPSWADVQSSEQREVARLAGAVAGRFGLMANEVEAAMLAVSPRIRCDSEQVRLDCDDVATMKRALNAAGLKVMSVWNGAGCSTGSFSIRKKKGKKK